MKKSLLALAVLGAFAGAASAQTNVTLYGIVDAGITYADVGGAAGTTWGLDSGNQSASRFGIRGTEDLGGGLSANFVLENGFDVSTGDFSTDGTDSADKLFSRLAYVGLNGGFGGVRLGRQVTPIKAAIDAIDPFGGAGQAGYYDYASAILGGTVTQERINNAVTYLTPNFAGFTGQVQYAFGERAEDEGGFASRRSYGVQVGYGNGPINVQFGYLRQGSGAGGFAGDLVAAAAEEGVAISRAGISSKDWFIGGTYNFGVAKVHASYQDTKLEISGADDNKIRSYLLGVTAPFGATTLLADWIHNDARDIDDGKSDSFNVGLTYALSKRTNLYTIYTHVKNDDGAAVGGAGDLGESVDRLAVGVRHTF